MADPPPPPPFSQTADSSSGVYSIHDDRIFWLNHRPYLLKKFLGAGGFGQVYKVELLVPPGLTPILDEHGYYPKVDLDSGLIMLTKNGRAEKNGLREDPSDMLVQDDGALEATDIHYALKVQFANSLTQYEAFLQELQHMQSFRENSRVLQLKDWHCNIWNVCYD